MITHKPGEAGVAEIESWTTGIVQTVDAKVQSTVLHDADSNTYVLRLAKENHVLLFRLSEAQILTADREEECVKILKRKVMKHLFLFLEKAEGCFYSSASPPPFVVEGGWKEARIQKNFLTV